MSVNRKANGPVFGRTFYNESVQEYAPIQYVMARVTATDTDPSDAGNKTLYKD